MPLLTSPAIRSLLLGEPSPVNLVNTRIYLHETWVDLLDLPEERAVWLGAEAARLGVRLSESEARGSRTATAVRAVREHVATALEPARLGERPPARALAGINQALREAPALRQARWEGSAVVAPVERPGTAGARLAAAFAESAVELLADPLVRRVRRCDSPSCMVVFLARNPRRRWCTPTICGNRARVQRYYLRHRPDPVTGRSGVPAGQSAQVQES